MLTRKGRTALRTPARAHVPSSRRSSEPPRSSKRRVVEGNRGRSQHRSPPVPSTDFDENQDWQDDRGCNTPDAVPVRENDWVSLAVFLTTTWSHLQCPCRCVLAPNKLTFELCTSINTYKCVGTSRVNHNIYDLHLIVVQLCRQLGLLCGRQRGAIEHDTQRFQEN